MKALYLRYCIGKIIEVIMYPMAYNWLSNFPVASRTARYLACAKTCRESRAATHEIFSSQVDLGAKTEVKKPQPLNCESRAATHAKKPQVHNRSTAKPFLFS